MVRMVASVLARLGAMTVAASQTAAPINVDTAFRSGSAMRRFWKFSLRLANAHGWYGMAPPSTRFSPAGTPSMAECASRFQWAVPRTYQMPFRSGLRSGVRGPVDADAA